MRHFVRQRENSWLSNMAIRFCVEPDEVLEQQDLGRRPKDHKARQLIRSRFHRAAYLALLLGPVFSKAYYEPFYTASEDRPADFLHIFNRLHGFWVEAEEEEMGGDNPYWDEDQDPWFSPRDLRYLEKFTPYRFNLDDFEGEKALFGPFAEWLCKDAMETIKREPGLTGNEQGFQPRWRHDARPFEWRVVREVMAVLFMVDQFFSHAIFDLYPEMVGISNLDGKTGYNRDIGNRPSDPGPVTVDFPARTTSVVIFGIFQVEEMTMSVELNGGTWAAPAVEDQEKRAVLIPGRTEPILKPSRLVDIPAMMKSLHKQSGRVNHLNDYPAPPPPLQFFTFMLREQFGLQFEKTLFCEGQGYHAHWNDFVWRPYVFIDQDFVHNTMLEPFEKHPRVWSYERRF